MNHCSKKLCERFCFQSLMLYVNCHEILIHTERMISITFLVHGHWYYHRAATLVQYFFCKSSKSATSKRRNFKKSQSDKDSFSLQTKTQQHLQHSFISPSSPATQQGAFTTLGALPYTISRSQACLFSYFLDVFLFYLIGVIR